MGCRAVVAKKDNPGTADNLFCSWPSLLPQDTSCEASSLCLHRGRYSDIGRSVAVRKNVGPGRAQPCPGDGRLGNPLRQHLTRLNQDQFSSILRATLVLMEPNLEHCRATLVYKQGRSAPCELDRFVYCDFRRPGWQSLWKQWDAKELDELYLCREHAMKTGLLW